MAEYRKSNEIKYYELTGNEQYVDLHHLKCDFMTHLEYTKRLCIIDNECVYEIIHDHYKCIKMLETLFDELPLYIIDNVENIQRVKPLIYNLKKHNWVSENIYKHYCYEMDKLFDEIYIWCERYNTDYHKMVKNKRCWRNTNPFEYPIYRLKPK